MCGRYPRAGKHRKIESASSQHEGTSPASLLPGTKFISEGRADQPKVVTVEFSSSSKTAPECKKNKVSIGSLSVQTSFSGHRGISSAHIFVQQCVVSGPVAVAIMVSLALTTLGPGLGRRFLVVLIVFVVVAGVEAGQLLGLNTVSIVIVFFLPLCVLNSEQQK